jgi:hypothetical protein
MNIRLYRSSHYHVKEFSTKKHYFFLIGLVVQKNNLAFRSLNELDFDLIWKADKTLAQVRQEQLQALPLAA